MGDLAVWTETRQVAEDAKKLAEAAVVAAREAGLSLERHIVACSKNSEALRRDLEERESRAEQWRRGLGERLDKQDSMAWKIAAYVIVGLFGIVGTLTVTLLHYHGVPVGPP